MRMLAVAALLAALLRPVLTATTVSKQRTTYVIALDVSGSMGLRDARLPETAAGPVRRLTGADPHRTPRGTLAILALSNGPRPALRALADRYDVRAFAFAEAPEAIGISGLARRADRAARSGSAAQGATQIGTVLREILDATSGAPVSGILLVSDGGSNQGDDPALWARRAGELGVPITTVGVGDPTPTRDVAVTEVLADRVVRKGNEVRVWVGLGQRGYGGSQAAVTLSRNGKPVASRTVRFGPSDAKTTVPFTFTPRDVGEFSYTVGVSRLTGETTAANNTRQFLQQVVDKKLRVLMVDGVPRWEFRYLKNAVLRDTQIGFACYLADAGGTPTPEGNLPVAAFPSDDRTLFSYDIVVLGDVPRSHFSETQLRALRRFVEDRGGSLVIIAGENHMPQEYSGTLLEPVLPLAVGPEAESLSFEEPFRWTRTPAGAQDALLRMAPDPVADARIWQELPGMLWMAGAQRARPGATVLVVNTARPNAAGPRPVLAVQPFGAGRCLMCMTDSTWLWRWRVGDRYFYRFWGQVLRTMTPRDNPGGNRFAQIGVDRSEYRPGDRVALTARMLDEFYRPIRRPEVAARLSGPSGAQSVLLRAIPGSPGLYGTTIVAGGSGAYRIELAPPVVTGPATYARFLVQQVSLEFQQPEMNEALLRRIAAASGGRFLGLEEVPGWVQRLPRRTLTVRSLRETDIWNAPILLLAALALLGLEWVFRRRAGMA